MEKYMKKNVRDPQPRYPSVTCPIQNNSPSTNRSQDFFFFFMKTGVRLAGDEDKQNIALASIIFLHRLFIFIVLYIMVGNEIQQVILFYN